MSDCRNCAGLKLVCENHQDQPWQADIGCECGAGAPCPVCQRDAAAIGDVLSIIDWLEDEGQFRLARRIEAFEYLPPALRARAAEAMPPRWAWQ